MSAAQKVVQRKPLSEETKEKIRQSLLGRKMPESEKTKHASFTGKKHSEETKAKMSASQKARADSFVVHPNTGKTASTETRAKMSASHKKQVQSEETKLKRSESIKAWHKQRKEQV
jgi:hypothetical protein